MNVRQRVTKIIEKIAIDHRSGEEVPVTEDERIIIIKGAGLPATFVSPSELHGKRADFIEIKRPDELPKSVVDSVKAKLDKELNAETDRMAKAVKDAEEKAKLEKEKKGVISK